MTNPNDAANSRRTMQSPYMEWAKTRKQTRYNLAASGVASFPLSDLAALAGLHLEDLEVNGPTGYGYEPLQQAIAAQPLHSVGTEREPALGALARFVH